MKKRKITKKAIKKDFNLLIGSLIFILLIGSAFAIDWIFGVFFIVGFVISILNKTLEHKPLIPILIFVGGLIIRVALMLVPGIIGGEEYIDVIVSVVIFLTLLVVGFSIRRGKI